MITKKQPKIRINTTGTKTPCSVSCYLSQIVFFVSNAGTSWTFQIRDKAATPSILLSGTLALPGDGLPVKVHFDESLYMDAGIDIVTAGTPGVVDVWLTYGLQA